MKKDEAFRVPIQENFARILLRLGTIDCEVENNAPDFVSVEKDDINLKISMPGNTGITIAEFDTLRPVKFTGKKKGTEIHCFEIEKQDIWFDIPIDQVKSVWVADLRFSLVSNNSKYLSYFITELDHQYEWLQSDMKSGEIKAMSISKKKINVQKPNGKESYTSVEVIRCADMLNRAIQKIDLRIGGAHVKFNTDKSRLEPLIIGMGDKLGYAIKALSEDDIKPMEASGENVSHSIFLK